MLQLQPPRFLPLPRCRIPGSSSRRRRARPPPLAVRSQWKLPEVDTDAVQERVRSWLSRARGAVVDATQAAREKGKRKEDADGRKEEVEEQALDFAVPEITVERRVGRGWLSMDAVVAIEQFARLNGLTGRKVQRIFKALAHEHVHSDARSLVEYCCFRYLSRDNSDLHPNLRELAFQRLIFVTMLAWEDPYDEDNDPHSSLDDYSILGRFVGEDAFVRIAPAVAGVADVSTAHHLFRALVGTEKGLTLDLWTTYLGELLKVHHGRQTHKIGDNFLSDEQVLCIGSSKKRPVLKWEQNTAWPGHLTLTNKALYFESMHKSISQCSPEFFKLKNGLPTNVKDVGLSLLKQINWDCVLDIQRVHLNKQLLLFLIECFDTTIDRLVINNQPIDIKPLVPSLIGLTNSELEVNTADDPGKSALYQKLTNDGHPYSALEGLAFLKDATDRQFFCICFILETFSFIFAPKTNKNLEREYLKFFKDVTLENLSKMNWCGLIADLLIAALKTFKDGQPKPKKCGGCLLLLVNLFYDLVKQVPEGGLKFPRANNITQDDLDSLVDFKELAKQAKTLDEVYKEHELGEPSDPLYLQYKAALKANREQTES